MHVPRFLNPPSSSSNSKNWLNAVLFTISKKQIYGHYVQIQVFLKSLWKMALKVHFLSDLGKIKPRNEEKRCILGLERLTLGVWGHCGAQNMDFLSLKGAGQVTVTKEVWTYFTRQKPILVPDGPRPQRKTFLDIFWRVFIISGLYFAWNRPEMHFLRHFWVKISQMPQKWSFFALNLHKKCNSGRFWAK